MQTGTFSSTAGDMDIVDEAIAFFRANVLFRNFEITGPADKLLVYLTLYISSCLQRESSKVYAYCSSSTFLRL